MLNATDYYGFFLCSLNSLTAPHDVNDNVWQYVEGKTCHIEVNYTNSTSDNSTDDDAVLASVYFHFDSVSLFKNTHIIEHVNIFYKVCILW